MLPPDLSVAHVVAVALLFFSWFSYSAILATAARGSLNAQLAVVRRHWITTVTQRETKPFDAILLGHIINSIAFFGSATLLVLAGVITTITSVKSIHTTMADLHFTADTSLELFTFQIGLVAFILALCFFSFTYALRKLIYVLTLVGSLPDKQKRTTAHSVMIDATTTVLSEAVKTFNFGIRGYYYAVAALALFASPYVCIMATVTATTVLFYRQLATPTARAISNYVEAVKSLDE